MLARTFSCCYEGVASHLVMVEADLLPGFSQFTMVGLPGVSVQEAKERVRSALHAIQVSLPPGRILVNLTPGDLPKHGTQWDLPIAVALLGAMGRIESKRVEKVAFLGELALDGTCRPISGAFAMCATLQKLGILDIYLPEENLMECASLEGLRLHPCHHLSEVYADLQRIRRLPVQMGKFSTVTEAKSNLGDYRDLMGQETLKRVLEIAVAGRHSLLLIGPPGVGKSLSLRLLPTILPSLSKEESIDVMKLHSSAGLPVVPSDTQPFHAPHHSITPRALLGGGNPPLPGEISLAHHGILFLDEMPQFSTECLNGLRMPLETHNIALSRGMHHISVPADFQLVATANPCPCGYFGDPNQVCHCTPFQIQRYQQRMAGPTLDRLDLVVWVNASIKANEGVSLASAAMKDTIEKARKVAKTRYRNEDFSCNARIPDNYGEKKIGVTASAKKLLFQLQKQSHCSLRVMRRLILVARTISDLDGQEKVTDRAVLEAFQYRRMNFANHSS